MMNHIEYMLNTLGRAARYLRSLFWGDGKQNPEQPIDRSTSGIYDLLFAKINGEILLENVEIEFSVHPDADFATDYGIPENSPVVIVRLKNAVPARGQEFDFASALVNRTPFEFQVVLAASGARCTVPKMYVLGPVTLRSATGKVTHQDVTLIGAAPEQVWV